MSKQDNARVCRCKYGQCFISVPEGFAECAYCERDRLRRENNILVWALTELEQAEAAYRDRCRKYGSETSRAKEGMEYMRNVGNKTRDILFLYENKEK